MKPTYKHIFTIGIMLLIGQSAVAQFDANTNNPELNRSNGFTIIEQGN